MEILGGGAKNATKHYNCMTIEEMKLFPIADLADENCALFMWVTFPILDKCFELGNSWGFEYSTQAFTWVKRNKKSDSWFWGLGNYTRANAEICLLFKKGKLERVSKSVHSIIDDRIMAHSKKPDITRDRIVQLLGDVPRIELFAREKTEGWDFWGNEVESDIELK